jgi:sulfoxide reductase heme-binding subunit YedZ
VIGVLALIHFFLQAKSDVTEPTLMAGLFLLLMSYRVAGAVKLDISRSWVLGLCAVVSAALTAGVEYAWYALATGIPPKLVFLANFDVETAIRPAVWVAIIGIAVALVPLLRLLFGGIAQLRPAKA